MYITIVTLRLVKRSKVKIAAKSENLLRIELVHFYCLFMGKPKEGITPQKRRAIQLRLEGKSWTQIARELKVTTECIWYWRRDPEFQALLVRTEEKIFEETSLRHHKYISDAFDALYKMVINESGEYSPRQQFNAAVKLIELTHKNIEVIKIVEQNRRSLDEYYAIRLKGLNNYNCITL